LFYGDFYLVSAVLFLLSVFVTLFAMFVISFVTMPMQQYSKIVVIKKLS